MARPLLTFMLGDTFFSEHRLLAMSASKDCLVYLEDIVSGLVEVAAPLAEGALLPQHLSSYAAGQELRGFAAPTVTN